MSFLGRLRQPHVDRAGNVEQITDWPEFPETLPCDCCESMFDYSCRHTGWVYYNQYFRWLEQQVRSARSGS